MRFLKTGVANVIDIGPAVIGSTDGRLVSPVTGLAVGTVDEIGVYKHGATALTSTTAAAITHRAGGIYTMSLTTGFVDTVGRLTFYCRDDSACLPIRHEFMVLPGQVYDSLVGGTDDLDVQVSGIDANAITATAIASNALTSAKIAANAIGASQIAADAIGSSELAATAVAEIWASTVIPSNWAALAISTAGAVTAGTVSDKAGYSLAADQKVDVDKINGSSVAALLLQLFHDAHHYGAVAAYSSTAPSITLSTGGSGATRNANFYEGQYAFVYAGPGAGQSRRILSGTTALVQTLDSAYVVTPTTASSLLLVPLAPGENAPTNWASLAITTGGVVSANTTLIEGTDATNQIDARINASTTLAAILADTGTAIPADLTLIKGTTAFNTATDSLEAIRNRGDAAWTGGSSGANPNNFDKLSISTAGVLTLVDVTQIEGSDATNQLVAAVNASTAVGAIPTTPLLAASAPTNFGNLAITTGGNVTAGNMRGTDSALLAASAPTNFGAMSITTGGDVNAGNMRGTDSAFLAASAPTNFGALSISTAGAIGTVTSLTNKTGFALGSTGLAAVVPADPTSPPIWGTANVVEHLAWRSAFDINEVVETPTQQTLKGSTGDTIGTATVTASTVSVTRGTFST